MKFLIDNALSPLLATGLTSAGYDAIHLWRVGQTSATDEEIFMKAFGERRVIVSADTDFGTIFTKEKMPKPSVILFRRSSQRRPEKELALLLANLPAVENQLSQGAVVVIEETRVRLRLLDL